MVKRKKHDKDKYYSLAKQQGYRARSAFKLIQLNKKYDFLSKAKVCIDLCAAPGGWCQVAAKYMPVSSIIIGIDLLPIRPIPNVKTFVCDITTQECRQIIRQELQTWKADIVLCDGAPNVGAEYSKDAYVQNELALIAMKLAVEVLERDGTFVTKVFRSQDYNALLWVFKQLFRKVSATKPLSSRNESAEIFVVCEQFLAPHSIDPKLLDPKYVFSQIEQKEKGVTIFHPKFGERKRHRDGYNEDLGVTLTNKCTVGVFLDATDPIRLLTDTTEIFFAPEDSIFKEHQSTSPDIVQCLQDLKVLGKADFKHLLKWRIKMIEYRKELLSQEETTPELKDAPPAVSEPKELTPEEQEKCVKEELAQLRTDLAAKKKREKKKERLRKAKLRLRSAMGLDLDAIELPNTEGTFDLRTLGLSKDTLESVLDPGAEDMEAMRKMGHGFDWEDSEEDEDVLSESEAEYERQMDIQMEQMYDQFLSRKGDKQKTSKAVKRSKVAKRAVAGEGLAADAAMYDGDKSTYKKMLEAEESSDDDEDVPVNPLVVKSVVSERSSEVVSRWFSSNPLFEEVSQVTPAEDSESDSDEEGLTFTDADGDQLPVMPKTDKNVRKEKRKQIVERNERRLTKKQKLADDDTLMNETPIEFVSSVDPDADLPHSVGDKVLTEKELADLKEKKRLIQAGMGKSFSEETDVELQDDFEVVPAAAPLPVVDDRKYDSEHEDYDAVDHARTMALASMMLRPSNAKELVDKSYNRYAWNDPAGLPDWFQDDEERHYRPQIPIPKHLMEQMKERFMEMATKPVKKVAEARARKKFQQMKKMKVAKKKATEIANLPDMSTREKMKAITKAMKGAEMKKSSKVYVVSQRSGRPSNAGKRGGGGGSKNGKVKLVDSRLKADKRGMDKKKKGKKRR